MKKRRKKKGYNIDLCSRVNVRGSYPQTPGAVQ